MLKPYSRKIAGLILATFILRCLLASMVHLGNDESYYFTYALQLDWNHFDHPPLVGIFIRIFTLNLHWVNDLSMRLTSIIAAAICTLLIFKCGTLLKNERAGWIAAILYNTSIYTGIISGLFILPDSPQLVFWLLTVYTAFKLLLNTTTKKQENQRLILLGLFIGLATMCKIHGVFLWFGIGAYILLYDRKYLKNPFLYLSILLTIIIISPIFFWNLHNHFITWRFQGQRVEIHHAFININSFLTTTLGQIFYNNPVNIIIYILTLVHLKNISFEKKPLHLLEWLAFPIIIATTFISLFRTTLPHWSGPGFIGLMIIASYVLEDHITLRKKKNYLLWLRAGAIVIITFIILGVLIINFYPDTLGNKKLPAWGKGDPTLDMYGWNELRHEFNAIRQKEIKEGKMKRNSPIVIDNWFPACHYLFYVAYPLHIPVIGVGNISNLHQFAWLNKIEGYVNKGSNAYYISSSNYYEDPQQEYKDNFKKFTLIAIIPQHRSGKIVRYWYIYRLEDATHQLGNILK